MMKIKTILATAFVTMLAFSSCSNHEETPQTGSETRSFFIRIGKPDVATRLEGADMSAQTVTFTDGYLIFTAGDKISHRVKIVAGTAGTDEVTVTELEAGAVINNIPANTKNVYLYGNLGSSLSGIDAASVKNGSLTNVESLVWTLGNIQNAANNVAGVPVYGKGDVAADPANPDQLRAEFNVGPIGARLQIGEVSCTDTRVEELKLAGIYINSFYHSMNANSTFKAADLVDYGIDKTQYLITGYATYPTMSDILTAVDLVQGAAKPATTGNFWAYNFFPSTMPHIVLHFASIKVGGVETTDVYATVSKYSKMETGGAGNEVTTAEAANVYTLNVKITDYENQISDLPESNSSVVGTVKINIINWQGNTIYPEW